MNDQVLNRAATQPVAEGNPQPACRAVIDVGTNSIKLLVAQASGHCVNPVFEQSHQTRLGGQGFYQSHRLQPGPISQSAAVVAQFATRARELGAGSIRVIATSAARDAQNAAELVTAIHEASGLDLEIISGQQEADWVFRGVTTDQRLSGQPLLLVDVGGGSSEFILGRGEQKDFACSFALGTVRLMEKIAHSDPPQPGELAACRTWVKSFLQREVEPALNPLLARERERDGAAGKIQLIGTGGTASILGCMEAKLESFNRERLEATSVSLDRLRWHNEHLWSLPLEARRHVQGLPPNRADVILTGTIIYEAILQQFGFGQLRISTRGLRFAAVL